MTTIKQHIVRPLAVNVGVAHTAVVSLSHIGSGQFITDPVTDGFICQIYACEKSPIAINVGQDWLYFIPVLPLSSKMCPDRMSGQY